MATKKKPTKKQQTSTNAEEAFSLYDALMWEIEPELTAGVIPHLDAFYSGETNEERHERAARYERAFKEFEKRWGELVAAWKEEMQGYRKEALQSLRTKSAREDAAALEEIERSIQEQ